jgi:hypothetical protein
MVENKMRYLLIIIMFTLFALSGCDRIEGLILDAGRSVSEGTSKIVDKYGPKDEEAKAVNACRVYINNQRLRDGSTPWLYRTYVKGYKKYGVIFQQELSRSEIDRKIAECRARTSDILGCPISSYAYWTCTTNDGSVASFGVTGHDQ